MSSAHESCPVAELPPIDSQAERDLRVRLARMSACFVFSRDYGARLADRLGVDPVRVHQVPVGCEHWARELRAAPAPPADGDRARILVLGAVRPGRQHAEILTAVEQLVHDGLDAELHVVGRIDDRAAAFLDAVARSPIAERVHVLAAEERELPTLVASSSVLVHLTEDEGTPVTPLEALGAGLPVVATRIPAFEEALGDAAELVDPAGDPRALAARIESALASEVDPDARDRRRAVAARYTWAACAAATAEAWHATLTG